MSDPYGRKPRTISEPNEWHEITFQISVDCPVDWDNVDLRKWGQTVAKYTALMMAESHLSEEEVKKLGVLKTLLLNLKVARVKFVDDNSLHTMIDEFGDEE